MIVLASKSPRRKELLEYIYQDFEVHASDIEENIDTSLPLTSAIEKLASEKANASFIGREDDIIIGADTIVVLENKIYGKPKDRTEAIEMLEALSGKSHHVISGVSIVSKDRQLCFHQITEVCFFELTQQEIVEYVDKYEPFDKAGAYAIQDGGALLIDYIYGDYYNVMGLPIALLNKKLKQL